MCPGAERFSPGTFSTPGTLGTFSTWGNEA